MISVNNISKSFGNENALSDISFEVGQGELFGIIGPDGAGKTTLFRIMTTLMLADQGTASINDLDVIKDMEKIRKMVGYMPGKFSLYQDLTVKENLDFFATMFGTSLKENYEIIKDIYIQIEPFKKRRAGKLSGGMKQKLALCCALIHNPSVIFLDEPTTGVDAVSRQEFWDMLLNLKSRGMTIIVSTPYMDEASLCDRIALIDKGKILSIDEPEKISGRFEKQLYKVSSNKYYKCLLDLRKYKEIERALPFGATIHITTEKEIQISLLHQYLNDHGHEDIVIEKITAGVEDVFLHLLSN